MAVLYAHVSAPPPPVTAARPELPAAVNEMLARALAKEPDDRYGSCGAFADALREALGLDPYDSFSGPWSATGQTRLVTPAGSASRVAATAPLTVPAEAPATVLSASGPSGSPSARAAAWTAVVAADRIYYDSVQAVSDTDAGSMVLPAFVPEAGTGSPDRGPHRAAQRVPPHRAGDRPDRPAQGPLGSPGCTPLCAPVLGVRPAPDAVRAERGLEPGDVRGRAEAVVDIDGLGERVPGRTAVAGVDELPAAASSAFAFSSGRLAWS
jgi:hypothetical protein